MECQALRKLSSYTPAPGFAPPQNGSSENGDRSPLPVAVAETGLRKSVFKPTRTKPLVRPKTTLPFDVIVSRDRSDCHGRRRRVPTYRWLAHSSRDLDCARCPRGVVGSWTINLTCLLRVPVQGIAYQRHNPTPNPECHQRRTFGGQSWFRSVPFVGSACTAFVSDRVCSQLEIPAKNFKSLHPSDKNFARPRWQP